MQQATMLARITIRFRPGVLDPEATTIQRSLHGLGFDEVEKVARAQVIELTLAGTDRARADSRLRQMCEKLLANPVIETFEIELEIRDTNRV